MNSVSEESRKCVEKHMEELIILYKYTNRRIVHLTTNLKNPSDLQKYPHRNGG